MGCLTGILNCHRNVVKQIVRQRIKRQSLIQRVPVPECKYPKIREKCFGSLLYYLREFFGEEPFFTDPFGPGKSVHLNDQFPDVESYVKSYPYWMFDHLPQDVTLIQPAGTSGFLGWAPKNADDRSSAVDFQQRLDVLDEIELFVLGAGPEVLSFVAGAFFLQILSLIHI